MSPVSFARWAFSGSDTGVRIYRSISNFFPVKKVQIEYVWIVKPRFSQDEFAKNKMLKFYSNWFLYLDLRFLFVEALGIFSSHIYKQWIRLLKIGT